MKKILLLLVAVFLASTVPAFAGTITTTGDLSDWGITAGTDGTAIDWTSPIAGVTSFVDPVRSGEFVDPGWGGANFDAYAMYYSHDSQNAYFGIVSGFPQTGRADGGGLVTDGWLYPGDLALKFNGMDNSSTYQYGVRLNPTEGIHTGAGDYQGVYKVTSWGKAYEGLVPPFETSDPTVITGGSKLGDASVTYKENTLAGGNPLFLYEVTVPLDIMDGQTPLNWAGGFDAHWTMTCGNDSLTLTTVTPEPVGMLLFGLGAGVLGLATKLRRKKTSV